MKKTLILLTILSFFHHTHAQSIDPEPLCREKCHYRGPLTAGQQRVAYFQYPSMNKYDVKYVKLDLNVETANRNISGTALTIARTLQPLDSFIAELKDNMIVDSVFVNGVKKTFGRGGDHVFIPLSPALPAGTNSSVLFYYRGLAGSNGVFAGTVGSNGLNYTATLSESYQGREWFPVKQFLPDKIDSADIWITTSATNLAGANGLLQAVTDVAGGKKRFEWKTKYPINYYLLSFSVGNYMEYKNYAKPAAMAPDSILIQHYIVNNTTFFNSNKPNLDKTPAFIEKLSELYGLYPFKNEKYGHAHANIGGGMEHQTMSTMSSFGTSLIAHELGHQWFGDNVTCASWNHIWINEGFASYSEYLLNEKLPALFTTTAAANMLSVHNDVLLSNTGSVFVPDASIYDENRIFSNRFTYNKGNAIIHTLRFEIQNDDLFFQTLKNFQQQFKDSVATAEDFKQVAETTTGKNFNDFFSQWYYGQGYPTFNVDYSKQGDSLVLFVAQTVSAPAITPFFKGLYEMRFNTAQGDTTVVINLTTNGQTFKFRSNRTPTGVVVDPNNWVLNKVGSITTGTNDPVNVSTEVKAFPNPSPGTIYLQYPAGWFDHLSIYDVNGRLLRKEMINRNETTRTVQISVASGVYVIHLNGKQKVASKKVIVR
jgi:aminopeptidase N